MLRFSLKGNVDAHAANALAGLYELPEVEVKLDFSEVQRVNSKGLGLLLKLFEHSEQRGVSMRVHNANRMTSMLFKMTNIERYLADGVKPSSAPRAVNVNPVRVASPQSASLDTEGKLRFMANMQNSQQANGWYLFNSYLQRKISREIFLDLVYASWEGESAPSSANFAFAPPFQSTFLMLEHGFQVVARLAEQADEITVLARADDPRGGLADFKGATVVTESKDSFVYLLGRFLLDEAGLPSEQMKYQFAGHELKSVKSLLGGEADMLFMATENYRNLSGLSRSRLRVLDETDSGLAFPMFCVSPSNSALLPGLRAMLLEMSQDAKGVQVLSDLGMKGWGIPEQEEIEMLAMLFRRYVGSC